MHATRAGSQHSRSRANTWTITHTYLYTCVRFYNPTQDIHYKMAQYCSQYCAHHKFHPDSLSPSPPPSPKSRAHVTAGAPASAYNHPKLYTPCVSVVSVSYARYARAPCGSTRSALATRLVGSEDHNSHTPRTPLILRVEPLARCARVAQCTRRARNLLSLRVRACCVRSTSTTPSNAEDADRGEQGSGFRWGKTHSIRKMRV